MTDNIGFGGKVVSILENRIKILDVSGETLELAIPSSIKDYEAKVGEYVEGQYRPTVTGNIVDQIGRTESE